MEEASVDGSAALGPDQEPCLDGVDPDCYVLPMDSACRDTIHRIGWAMWGLFAVAIHLWAMLIANRIPWTGGGTLSTATSMARCLFLWRVER